MLLKTMIMKIKINNMDRQSLLKTQDPNPWTLSARLKSFCYAMAGIKQFFIREPHAKIHLMATLMVLCAGFYFRVNTIEAIALTITISLVWISEMINTAIEKAMDLVSREINPQIKLVKDVAAGAVLLAAICALVVGAIIFIPKIFYS